MEVIDQKSTAIFARARKMDHDENIAEGELVGNLTYFTPRGICPVGKVNEAITNQVSDRLRHYIQNEKRIDRFTDKKLSLVSDD